MNHPEPAPRQSLPSLNRDEAYMQRCLDLAAAGLGHVAPNPLVGSVVVYNDRIIGEGYHRIYGQAHAEPNAIASVKEKDLLPQATLYVNLEPCSHTGKTPPCSRLIISSGIKRVVVGTTDSNILVKGKGIAELRKSGCRVDTGILEQQCRFLNRRFFTFHEKKRPYIILKWAQTLDGYIDILPRLSGIRQPTWITSEKLRMLVHKWRSEEPAIMVGTNTAAMDNPRLNVREWHGKQPVRLIIDKKLVLSPTLHVFDQSQQTIVFNTKKETRQGQIKWVRLPFESNSLWPVLEYLHAQQIQSVFVEGGQKLAQSFLDQGLWDEARVFVGSRQFGKGIAAPAVAQKQPSRVWLGKECFYWFQNTGY
jgi:diaminohydroxyphosphoribosylaminopyrimidine deaminase / 5-amino-6-(5-phosphoribosylamino)uracil reductase